MLDFHPVITGNSFRAWRFQLFKQIVDRVISEKGGCRILDVGGTAKYWEILGSDLKWDKLHVCLLNLSASETCHPGMSTLLGDARDVKQLPDRAFDIVHSNSVVEHVGGWNDMVSMANEIRRLAPSYFVQTPYFWFPIEPHARLPLFHWMPESWRYRIIMSRTCGFLERKTDLGMAMQTIQSIVLLDKRQMQFLFPDARIVSERFLGLTKSLIAIRQAS